MAVWLYPLSGKSGHGFVDSAGTHRPASFDAIRQAVIARRFPSPARWSCAQNGGRVERGDELFLYTGEGDVGIFAAGTVLGAQRVDGAGWLLTWKLDLRRTRRLLENPVPAPKVRKHVHPRVTVRDFATGARALRRSLE